MQLRQCGRRIFVEKCQFQMLLMPVSGSVRWMRVLKLPLSPAPDVATRGMGQQVTTPVGEMDL